MMYLIGRYISINNVSLRMPRSVALYAGTSLLVAIAMVFLCMRGKFEYAWRLTYYNNILVIIDSIGLFMIFKNINIKQNKIINRMAISAFAIYLFHYSLPVMQFLKTSVTSVFEYSGSVAITLIFIIVLATAVGLIAILVDQIRIYIYGQICKTKLFSYLTAHL